MTTVTKRRTTKATIVDLFSQHVSLKSEAATIVKRADKLKAELKTWMADNFSYTNENGSKFFDLPDTVRDAAGVAYAGMELRHVQPSPKFNEETAEKVLAKKGVLEEALSTYVDQDKVYRLVQEGKISEDDLDLMFEEQNDSWAFWPIKGEVI